MPLLLETIPGADSATNSGRGKTDRFLILLVEQVVDGKPDAERLALEQTAPWRWP